LGIENFGKGSNASFLPGFYESATYFPECKRNASMRQYPGIKDRAAGDKNFISAAFCPLKGI